MQQLRKFFKKAGGAVPQRETIDVDGVLVPSGLDALFKLDTFTLRNGLEVCMYSWQTEFRIEQPCTLSLSVKAGSCNDFEYCPGVAHLLEHVLFHSSELYPGPFEFPKLIHEVEGAYNAFTEDWETVYHFQTRSADFIRVFSAFSQMFIAPTFDPSYVNAEAHVVDNEFARSIDSKAFRDIFVHKIIHPTENPRSRIACGNLDTFVKLCQHQNGKELATVLQDFFNVYYVPTNMKVAVFVGELDKEEMKNVLTHVFERIPRKRTWRTVQAINPRLEQSSETPFDEKFKGKILYVKPRVATHTIKLIWKVSSYKNFYKSLPYSYVTMFLLRRAKDSLLNTLLEKKWAVRINAYQYIDTYEVEIICTEAGLAHYRMIVEIAHAYLGMIKETVVSKFAKVTAKLVAWLPNLPSDLASLCNYTAVQMLNFEKAHWLIGGNELIEQNLEEVEECLSRLHHEECVTVVVADEVLSKCDIYNPQFLLHYGIDDIEIELPESFGTLSLSRRRPRRYGQRRMRSRYPVDRTFLRPLMPTNLDESFTNNEALTSVSSQTAIMYFNPDRGLQFLDELKGDCDKGDRVLAGLLGRMVELSSKGMRVCNITRAAWLPPALVYSSSQILLWQKCDMTGDYVLTLRVASERYQGSAHLQATTQILVLMVQSYLRKKFGFTEENAVVMCGKFGGVLVALRSDSEGVIAERLHVVVRAFWDVAQSGGSFFKKAKEAYLTKNCNTECKKPGRVSQENIAALLNYHLYTNEDLQTAARNLSFRHIAQLASKFGKEDMIHAFYSGLSSSFHKVLMSAFEIHRDNVHPAFEGDQVALIPPFSQNYYMVPSGNPEDVTSGVTICYQLDNHSCKTEALLRLYVQSLEYPAHRYFRSDERVTYHVDMEAYNLNGVPSLWFSCESSGCDPIDVDTKLERFFYKSSRRVQELSVELLMKYKRGALRGLLNVSQWEAESKMARDAFWTKHCVEECTYDFLRAQHITYYILTATKDDLIDLYKTYFAPFSKRRRKLVSGVFSREHLKSKLGDSHPVIASVINDHSDEAARNGSYALWKCKELSPVYDSLGVVRKISSPYDFRDSLRPVRTKPELAIQTDHITLGYISPNELEPEEETDA